jgi:hypothetical protein
LYFNPLAAVEAVWKCSKQMNLDELAGQSYDDWDEFIDNIANLEDEEDAGWSLSYKYGNVSVTMNKVQINKSQGSAEACRKARESFVEYCKKIVI